MKALLIDPTTRTVTEIHIDGSLQSFYAALGCKYVAVACDLPNGDTIYVDDEGLFAPAPVDYFQISHGYQPYAGKGLIVHTDQDGETRAVKSTLDDIKSDVVFIPYGTTQAFASLF